MTFGKLQAKAVLKDVGRVMQIPYMKVDEICKLIPFNPAEPITLSKALSMDPKLQEEVLQNDDINQFVSIAMTLEGLNRHTSTHAAGIIIADKDLREIAPIHKDHTSELGVVGFNMKDAEKIGLVKFDFLGLKTLSVISETCKLIKEYRGIDLNIHDISLQDKETFTLLGSTKTKGIFQFEAAITREVLHQIKVERIEEMIAVTSLARPGP